MTTPVTFIIYCNYGRIDNYINSKVKELSNQQIALHVKFDSEKAYYGRIVKIDAPKGLKVNSLYSGKPIRFFINALSIKEKHTYKDIFKNQVLKQPTKIYYPPMWDIIYFTNEES